MASARVRIPNPSSFRETGNEKQETRKPTRPEKATPCAQDTPAPEQGLRTLSPWFQPRDRQCPGGINRNPSISMNQTVGQIKACTEPRHHGRKGGARRHPRYVSV